MNKFQLGKMYLVKEYFWFLFPTKELAASSAASGSGSIPTPPPEVAAPPEVAKVLSEYYNCNVAVVEENTCVVLLEMDETEHCYKLLDSNGNIGWIICRDFSKNFELVKE